MKEDLITHTHTHTHTHLNSVAELADHLAQVAAKLVDVA